MRFRYLAVFASLAGMAACSDSPVTQAETADLYDLSKVTILEPEQYAANGIAPLAASPSGPRFLSDPCEIDYPESCDPGDPGDPPPVAALDYWGGVFDESYGSTKSVRLHAKSDAHNNMDQTILNISYKSVGAQGPYGCNATPAQFDSDYLVDYGAPVHVVGERYASYPSSMSFVWAVESAHTFTANAGYVVYLYYRTHTFPGGGSLCV